MIRQIINIVVFCSLFVMIYLSFFVVPKYVSGVDSSEERNIFSDHGKKKEKRTNFPVPHPPIGNFPCLRCHDDPEGMNESIKEISKEHPAFEDFSCSKCHMKEENNPKEIDRQLDILIKKVDGEHHRNKFPCTECHDDPESVDRTRRDLSDEDVHPDIKLHHDEKNRWCLDCHDAGNRDKLHLTNGRLIDFEKSYILCGQCHGDKLRDWKNGIHGKRTGQWNGKKQYLLCAHCHNPHSPRFQPIKPLPPPIKPAMIK